MTIDVPRGAVGVPERFAVKVGLHQGSAFNHCLFATVIDRMTDGIRLRRLHGP